MKVLVIDDSVFIQKIYIALIKGNFPDAVVFNASNGAEGLRVYEAEKPSWIITDLLMPEMTGMEMVQAIRQADQDTRIIVVTADIQKSVRDEMENMKISAFINKPLTDEKRQQLVDIIRGC